MKRKFTRIEIIVVSILSFGIVLSTITSVFLGYKAFNSDKLGTLVSRPSNTSIEKPDKNYKNYDFSSKIKNGVLSLKDCEAKSDAKVDYGDLFRSVFKTAFENNVKTVELAKGTYYVAPESKDDFYTFDFEEYEYDGLTIKGNGCKLVLLDNYSGCFSFRKCKNITIEDITFDCYETPFLQATVAEYDKKSQIMKITCDKEYTVLEDSRINDRQDTRFGMVRDKDNPILMKESCNNFFKYNSFEKLSSTVYKIALSSDTKYFTNDYIEVGDKIILNNRGSERTFIFDICNSGTINFKNILINNSPGGGVVGNKNSGDIVLSDFKMMPAKGSGNWVCGNADAVHIQGCRGKVVIENCTFSNLSDDAVNLYQWFSDVSNVVSSSVIDVTNSGVIPNVGDTVEIVEPTEGKILGKSVVKSKETVDGKRIDVAARITLQTPISGLEVGASSGKYCVFTSEDCFIGSSVKNSTFKNIRGRGLLLRTTDMIVENNTFSDISNHAFEAWFNGDEGFEVNNLVFKSNKIDNVSYLKQEADSLDCGAISVHINGKNGQSKYISHDTIRFIGNTFKNYHGCALNVANAKNITITDNDFSINKVLSTYSRDSAIFLNYCQGVSISGNTFNDARTETTASIMYDSKSVSNINIGTNTFATSKDKRIVLQ